MIARRSNKCTAFLNHYYGRVYKMENVFENTQLNTLWRIMFGIPLTDQNHNIQCTGCNMLLDHTTAYIHVFDCRFGRAHHYRHDGVTKWIYDLLNSELSNVELEQKPRHTGLQVLSESNMRNDRPDIIIHDKIELEDKTMSKVILDTVITNVFCSENERNIKNGKISLFMAGKIGERNKNRLYRTKFENQYQNGYKFRCLAIENTGGISKVTKHIISQAILIKAKRTGRDYNKLLNNAYIELSSLIKKQLIKSIYNHIKGIYRPNPFET